MVEPLSPVSPDLQSNDSGTPKKTIHQKLQLPSSQNSARRSARVSSSQTLLQSNSSPVKQLVIETEEVTGDTGSDTAGKINASEKLVQQMGVLHINEATNHRERLDQYGNPIEHRGQGGLKNRKKKV